MRAALLLAPDQPPRSDRDDAPGGAAAGVQAMLDAMVRREPAHAVVLPFPGGAAGVLVEPDDPAPDVLEVEPDGSFAIVDRLLLRPRGAAALLRAVRRRGLDALRALDGSFGAVVHDAPARRTLIVTDRFATRPLYVREARGRFACASEAKALFVDAAGGAPSEDPLAIYDLVNFGFLAGERTWFDGVRLLPDGTAVVLEEGKPPRRARYRERLFEPGRVTETEGLERVAAAYEWTMRQLGARARRPAILLSGGLDSRTIASFAVRVGLEPTCYTFGPPRANETKAARGIARALGLPITRCETPPELLPRWAATATWITDGHVSLSDIHFLDHHVNAIGPRHDAFFDGWLGGVIGGGWYVKESDFALRTRDDLARAIAATFDFMHPQRLEERLYDPFFLRRLRERAIETPREFLADWELDGVDMPVAKEAACLRFRDRRWQLFHNGVVAEPFCRGLRPYAIGELVDAFQSLPIAARMNAGFYQRLIAHHFPRVAAVRWEKTGRAIGKPPSPVIDASRRWKRLAFYYLARLTGGRIDLRDMTTYAHYDRQFRRHPELASFFEATIDPRARHLRPDGLEALVAAEKGGGPYFPMLARLLQAELVRRTFFEAAAAATPKPVASGERSIAMSRGERREAAAA